MPGELLWVSKATCSSLGFVPRPRRQAASSAWAQDKGQAPVRAALLLGPVTQHVRCRRYWGPVGTLFVASGSAQRCTAGQALGVWSKAPHPDRIRLPLRNSSRPTLGPRGDRMLNRPSFPAA